jgi:predicted O-methyltransferase YrrM
MKFFLPQVSASFLGKNFEINEYGPTSDAEVSFIGRGDLNVPGGTNDTEAWILAVLAKNSKNMFEFGTCTGKTAYLWAQNSSDDAKVFTLTLPPSEALKFAKQDNDSNVAITNALNESKFEKFIYTGTKVENKINQIFIDSKKFDETKYLSYFDLIFIDGSHAYSFVQSDTEKAFKMLKPNGVILWHDYNANYINNKDVCNYLDNLSKSKKIYHVKDTSLVVYKNM